MDSKVARLNVFRWGDPRADRTVVALHGITANSGAMTELARPWAECGWQFLAPDMRGHGESTRANGEFSLDSLLADFAESVPCQPDVLLGHSFGGTLAQFGLLRGVFRPSAIVLEDPLSHFADQETPRDVLDWDEKNLPRDIDGLLALNPGWSKLDAAWKLPSLIQLDFRDARAAFAGNAPWDLRDEAKRFAETVPTIWVLTESGRFVPLEDQHRLRREVGEQADVVMRDVGHSVHRDATSNFVDIIERLASGNWF